MFFNVHVVCIPWNKLLPASVCDLENKMVKKTNIIVKYHNTSDKYTVVQ